jgi:beta-glucanase (GH16 family)
MAFLLLLSGNGFTQPPSDKKWKLIFKDEFNSNNKKLEKKWDFQNGPTNKPSALKVYSRWRDNAVEGNGILKMMNKKESRAGAAWTSVNMWTKKPFKYGYFECRFKYGNTTGLNNAFWLITSSKDLKPGDKGFELDINEGHYPDTISMTIHDWYKRGIKKPHVNYVVRGANLSEEFHTYALEWTEDEFIWYFDGKEIRRDKNIVAQVPARMYLSSAIITWGGGPITDAIDGTSMDVDYVRVYQRK